MASSLIWIEFEKNDHSLDELAQIKLSSAAKHLWFACDVWCLFWLIDWSNQPTFGHIRSGTLFPVPLHSNYNVMLGHNTVSTKKQSQIWALWDMGYRRYGWKT